MTMMTTITKITRRRDAHGERLFGCLLGGMELLTVQLGVQTGGRAADAVLKWKSRRGRKETRDPRVAKGK